MGEAVMIKNPSNGRLPFWEAIAAGITWNDGLEQLLRAYPHSLHGVDPVTELPAFLLSATAATRLNNNYDHQSDTNTILAPFRDATTTMVDARGERMEACTEEEQLLSTIYTLLRRDPSQLQRTTSATRGR